MRVAMIGTGYVGLVSSACLADFGHHVTCVDKDAAKIAMLEGGQVPIFEPGLAELVTNNLRQGRLEFTTDMRGPVANADVVFITVGTPSRPGDRFADLSQVYAAAREIAAAIQGFTVIVTKSTVPVGTSEEVELITREVRPDADFAVVANPEFLREGAAIRDFKLPDRIVIGADDPRARDVMAQLYRPLYLNAAPILYTDHRTAELTKYAANAFLATKITFINELADLCEQVGADVQQVARGMGLDNRIGPKFLHAGPGFGGSCFPKDLLALMKIAQDYATPMRLVETVVAVNDARKRIMARKIARVFDGGIRGLTVAVLGLTFKPNTDDMRDAPSIPLIAALHDMGAKIKAYDPAGMTSAQALLPEVTYCDEPYSCTENADAVVICTEWEQFRALDLDRVRSLMRQPVLVDLRNIYEPEEMERHGFIYSSVGRPTTLAQRRIRAAKAEQKQVGVNGNAIILPVTTDRHVTTASTVVDVDAVLR
jgi:UDPglucose 6-dehydrogenase